MRNILSSRNIVLSLIEEDDIQKRVEWINDPVIQLTLHYDYPTSLARGKKWFDKVVMDRSRVDFSIRTKTTNEYIGFCGLINVDRTVKKAELYIVIGKKSEQGKGIGTEAYLLTTNYGFLELGLNRIYGFQNTDNIAALKAVKKIGWELEGRLRQDLWAHGKMYDRNIVSILRNDWENSRIYDI